MALGTAVLGTPLWGETYIERLKVLHPTQLLPLGEPVGATVAVDQSGNGFNGSYVNALPGTAPGMGDGHLCPTFDGTGDYVDNYSAALAAAFTKLEFSIVAWFKMLNAAVWDDATLRAVCEFGADINNRALLYKSGANQFTSYFIAGGVAVSGGQWNSVTTADWVCTVMTVSKSANKVYGYWNGVVQGTGAPYAGTWAGTLAAGWTQIGGVSGVTNHKGYEAMIALIPRALSANEAYKVSRVS